MTMDSPSLEFVDTHHHLWDLENNPYSWLSGVGAPSETEYLGDYAAIRENYLIDNLLSDYAGHNIVKSVHVQADFSGEDPTAETRWLQAIADKHGFPHAIVSHTDLRSPSAAAELDRHCESPNMRGVRMMEHEEILDDRDFRRGVGALSERGLSFDLSATPETADQSLDLVSVFPDTSFILTHTGAPYERSPEYFQHWRTGMKRFAEAPNLTVKISGLGMRDRNWSVESIRPWVVETIEILGVDRCMFGTNWPVDRLYSDFGTLMDAYRTIIREFSHDEQEILLCRNAEHYYRI